MPSRDVADLFALSQLVSARCFRSSRNRPCLKTFVTPVHLERCSSRGKCGLVNPKTPFRGRRGAAGSMGTMSVTREAYSPSGSLKLASQNAASAPSTISLGLRLPTETHTQVVAEETDRRLPKNKKSNAQNRLTAWLYIRPIKHQAGRRAQLGLAGGFAPFGRSFFFRDL